MISSFSVFSAVINAASLNFNLACRKVALKICRVVLSIVQAPFHKRHKRDFLRLLRIIFKSEHLDFNILAVRNKKKAGQTSSCFLRTEISCSQIRDDIHIHQDLSGTADKLDSKLFRRRLCKNSVRLNQAEHCCSGSV